MTPAEIDRVFGRGRLKMVTGEHVEVFREAVGPGERRRYTKRFLNTPEGDFGQWTEREWRILARLIGHGISCVPDVVQFDRGRLDAQIVQTYDAGVTVDQWATLLPVTRDERTYGHVFEDCAHWWALAHHCLAALHAIHPLELVHLDIKGDNVCIPYAPAGFDPNSSGLTLRPVFEELALIDFAFALISRASLATALPIGWQRDYDYQSPRLLAALEAGRNGDLQPTRDLDWRCDLYSLAAMMKRYLPDAGSVLQTPLEGGWTAERYDAAKALILRIREFHDGELPAQRPHGELIELTGARLAEPGLASSLERGWSLAREACASSASASPLTPVTRLAPSIRVARSGRSTAVTVVAPPVLPATRLPEPPLLNVSPPPVTHRQRRLAALIGLTAIALVGAATWYGGDRAPSAEDALRAMDAPLRSAANPPADAIPQLTQSGGDAQPAGDGPDKVARSPAGEAPSAASSGSVQESAPTLPTQGSAPAPDSAPREHPATVSPPSTPDAVASAPLAAPDVTALAVPNTQQQAGPPAVPSMQRRTAPGRAPTPAANKSPGGTPPKQASTPSKSGNRTARVPPGVAPAEPRTTQARPTVSTPAQAPAPAQRVYAPWASLEPPAWARSNYRGKGPGVPPGASTADAAVKTAPLAEVSPPESAPAAAQPARVAATTAEPSRGEPARLASAQVAPAVVESRNRAVQIEQPAPENFVEQGRRMIVSDVPRIAARAEPQIARVLRMAGAAYYQTEERYVAEATRATRISDDAAFFARPTFPGEARRFNDEARAVLGSRRNVAEAFEFQLRAFGANPRDPEIAGNLASLHLRLNPSQPEVARQIALVALLARDPQYHSSRLEDWFTFAVASALGGRESDATNALFVTLALTADVDRRCATALNALANYGERMRRPVEAMFYRIHAQGRGIDSQACAWPANGSLVSRSQ